MAQVNLNIRVDDETKKKFEQVCDGLGISMSMAIVMFMKSTIREESLNFLDLSLKNKKE